MGTISTHHSEPFISRLWQPHPPALLELWQHEAPRTLRIYRSFADADLLFRAKGGGRSVAELFQHITDSYWLTGQWLSCGARMDARKAELPRTVEEAVAFSSSAQASLFDTLANVPDAEFEKKISPFGVLETCGVFALGMLKHEIHHRGELYALARVCGHVPEGLYVPIR